MGKTHNAKIEHKLDCVWITLPDTIDMDYEAHARHDQRHDHRQLVELQRRVDPQLAHLGALAERERANVELAKRSAFPDVTLGISAIDTRDSDMDVDDSGKDPLMATLAFNLPIWAAHRPLMPSSDSSSPFRRFCTAPLISQRLTSWKISE